MFSLPLSVTGHQSPKDTRFCTTWLKERGAEHEQQLSRLTPCYAGTASVAKSALSTSAPCKRIEVPAQAAAKVKWSVADSPGTSEEHHLFYPHHDFHYETTFQGTKLF